MVPYANINDFFYELVFIGIDSLVLTVCYSAYRITRSTIENIKVSLNRRSKPHVTVLFFQDAPVIDLDGDPDLAKVIKNHRFVNVNEDGEVCIPYAVVRGNVVPIDKTLPTQLAPVADNGIAEPTLQGVLRRNQIIEHSKNLSRFGFWYDSERMIQEYTNQVPFCLVAPSLQQKLEKDQVLWSALGNVMPSRHEVLAKSGVEITDLHLATQLDLDVTKDVFDSANNGTFVGFFGLDILGWMTGVRQHGVQTKEMMLFKGSTRTAIGELVLSDNKVKMQMPSGLGYFIVNDKSFVKDLESASRGFKYLSILLGGLGLGVLCFVGYRFYCKRKNYYENHITLERIIQEREENFKYLSILLGGLGLGVLCFVGYRFYCKRKNYYENHITLERIIQEREENERPLPSDMNCVVCMNQRRQVIFLPCGHVCVCARCSTEIVERDGICPVCRRHIESRTPAFIA